ncbi:MarR family winged helix-turn-helix transcriptional regulator [Celeribacter sp. PS-C1]|uniref:MarR family winged helix-turn-helix transcriptional regulator n=1 Tax=Celeribacter sp. PS-C1 TaxID=2820813 RepID=UPI001C667E59|nr:MarR family transcriptional regulator [Celeribacter sp. PS-C1]MBW6417024.1 MarR family transcriptional regulator [Celeribacter sp. PS-C1]
MTEDNTVITELDGIGSDAGDIRHLFTYNLQRLAGMSSRIASLSLEKDFNLTVQEWRALAVLDFLNAAPLHLLAQRAGVQKSQMSRLVIDLEDRGLVVREKHPKDKRSVLLRLSDEAQALVQRALVASRDRNARMLAHLDDAERKLLMHLVGKVIIGTSEALDEVKDENETPLPGTFAPASLYQQD